MTKEENKCSYLTLVKKLEKVEEVIVTEQYGLIPDGKGAKIRRRRRSLWDILEGHKNPAPLSWHWFQAVKTERKPMKYEESFQNMKYMKNTMEKPTSYYLSDPTLPDEYLQPTKDSKEEEKNKADAESSRIAGNQGVAPTAA